MKNLHKLYYKDYFSELKFEEGKDKVIFNSTKSTVKSKNREILDLNFSQTSVSGTTHSKESKLCSEVVKRNKFPLRVAYPGLVTGIGINHEIGEEGEFKLGLHLDYTTGMPVIYGSTVKGVLRSFFDDYLKNHSTDYLNDFENKEYDVIRNFTEEDLKEFIAQTFDGKTDKKNISIYERDIFFDAVITSEGKFLESDSITPHGDNPLTNPIPLTFLKIAPGVEFQFRFKLNGFVSGDKRITAIEKRDLFRQILLYFGIGAKTNVGYGQFDSVEDPEEEARKAKEAERIRNESERIRREQITKDAEDARLNAENIKKQEEEAKRKQAEDSEKKKQDKKEQALKNGLNLENTLLSLDRYKREVNDYLKLIGTAVLKQSDIDYLLPKLKELRDSSEYKFRDWKGFEYKANQWGISEDELKSYGITPITK